MSTTSESTTSSSTYGLVIGGVAGGLVLIVVALAVALYVVCFKGKGRAPEKVTVHNNPAASFTPPPAAFRIAAGAQGRPPAAGAVVPAPRAVPPRLRPRTPSQSLPRSRAHSRTPSQERHYETQLFQLAQVKKATRNFMHKIGEGGFGPVYYGKLPSGQKVAVKVQAGDSQQGEQEFYNEVHVLSRVHHENLVSLVGYCNEDNERMLVYEYCPGGTLQEQLHEPINSQGLDWGTRLTIALDAATGLEYLHKCSPAIIHRDIKSSNILLAENMMAKVADFGLSKLTPADSDASHVTTIVKGTSGYLDPEYFQSLRLTQKSDVYSFGIVLLEIISGREPVIEEESKSRWRISEWARKLMQDGNAEAMVDPLMGSDYGIDSLLKVAEVAMFSVEPRSIHRPTMSEVVKQLTEALALEVKDGETPSDTPKSSGTWSRSSRDHSSQQQVQQGLDNSAGSKPAYTRFEFYDSGPAYSRSFSLSKLNVSEPDYTRLEP